MKGRYNILFTGRRKAALIKCKQSPCTTSTHMLRGQHAPGSASTCGIWLWKVEQEWRILKLKLRGCIMTSVSCCWAKSKACENACPCKLYVIETKGYSWGYKMYLGAGVSSYRSPPIFAFFSLLSISLGIGSEYVGPSGQSQRRDTRSAWCSGQTLQQNFLCSTHLLVLAHSSGPQHRSGQALANRLVQQPDHFKQDFSVSTVSSN